MSSWIGTFNEEEKQKRKRITKLSITHGTNSNYGSGRSLWRVNKNKRSFRNKKRVRRSEEDPEKNVECSDGGEKKEDRIQDSTGNDGLSKQIKELERNEKKILIDTQTLEMIKNEVENLLPTSLHNMASSLAEAESIIFFHSQQNHFRSGASNRTLFFSRDRMYATENTAPHEKKSYGRRQRKIVRQTKGKQNSIGLLTSVFNNMGVLQEDDYDDYDEENEDQLEFISPRNELKNAFHQLSKQVGSIEERVETWEEAQSILQTIFIFPRMIKQRKKQIKSSKKKERVDFAKSLKQYMTSLTRGAFKKGHLKAGEKWKQITVTASNAEPLADELARIQISLDKAKMNRKEEKILEKVDRLMEEKQKQKVLEREKAAEEAAKNILRSLTPSEQDIVQECIYGDGSGGEIIAMSGTDSVQRDSIRKLQPGRWLNDEVIHYFLVMLAKRDEELCDTGARERRSHYFKSFFITKLLDENGYNYRSVKRWSKKVVGKDIFNLDKVMVPVNISGMHWCLVVIFVQEKRIQFYDSMGGGGTRYLDGLMKYLKDEHMDKKKTPLEGADEWKLVVCQPDTPQQENGFDCGVFTCMFADFISQDMPLLISQEHISECRDRIALSIMNGKAIV